MRKHTIEYVKSYFAEHGCELLGKYSGSRNKMKYICECGDVSKISFSKFKMGRRCKKCGILKRSEKLKHSFEYVEQYFLDEGCVLLETEYINSHYKMIYICSCGEESKISFDHFKKGQRCRKCGIEKNKESQKHTFEFVYNYFKEQGCILLETEYINNSTLMRYICSCDNVSETNFNNFKKGHRCRKCGTEKCAESQRHTIKFAKHFFKDQGCELLEEEYIGANTKMRYICSCGNISEMTFANFQFGQRCMKCGGCEKYTLEYVEQCFKDGGCILLETEYINNRTKMKYMCNCGHISKICFGHFQQGGRCNNCANRGYSKESQVLFDTIYKKLNKKQKDKTYYATLNHEFGIKYNGKGFKYDYVNSKSKKVIEYNGRCWHPQPQQKNNEIGWFALDKNKTVKEARSYEKIKYEGLEKRGYQILTVWDYESHKDFDTLVRKCLAFLTI